MKSREQKTDKGRKKGRVRWGVIYVAVFLVVFAASAMIKLTYNPLEKKYKVIWNDDVGRVYTDLPYGEGEANQFDLYVPADNHKKSYGLIVYLHAGGFTSGDKSGDAEMLKYLCAKGYVTAGINYTLFGEEHPEANVYTQSQEIKESIPAVVKEAEKLDEYLERYLGGE